jgi:RimJ/RimL family protein N-acetyltransferase
MTHPPVHLRPIREADLVMLTRFATDPDFSAPYEWSGFKSSAGFRRRWEEDGFLDKEPRYLAVADPDETVLGWVMWRDPNLFGRDGRVWEIGVLLAPEHRGRGAGTEAQRLIVEHLFDTTTTHRLCAYTEADNVAEQRSLERCGFRREGLLREAGFRGGRWRDVVTYGRLRSDGGRSDSPTHRV